MLENKTQFITYVGKKSPKTDTVAGTGTIWAGHGDTQEVIHGAAVKLLQHPDVWVTEAKFKAMQQTESAAPPAAPVKPVKPVKPAVPVAPATSTPSLTSLADAAKQNEGEGEGDGSDSPPDAARLTVIKAAILSLEPGNEAHFSSRTKAPLIGPVRDIAGDQTISAAEVSAAWQEMSKAAK